ncbi:MAG: dTMP kinase [Kiritimatiellales bacterium]|nr:dTMP kinase [Kiritimatiellales bacterium]
MAEPGKFITFEGPDGSGKSTQVRLLAERLKAQCITVHCTREPGGTATGEAIRNILQHDAVDEALGARTELLLFAASRAQLMNFKILPALERGDWIICDRFIDSTMAYQGYGRGLPLDTLNSINHFAIGGRKPDVTLLLDLDVGRAFQRMAPLFNSGEESPDRFEREDREFHEKVRAGYLELADGEPDRFRVVDADRLANVVADEIWNIIKATCIKDHAAS